VNSLMLRILCAAAVAALGSASQHSARAAETEGVHCSVVYDQDGDECILLESEWISMHLLPRMQAIINRFVFRPTGNDIEEPLQPKIRMMGGGILMDCLWEQDWRFQELKEKPYHYKITKNGPEEGQVIFETDIVGWVGANNSGLISKLLSNLTLRRTVTLKSGQPFFRFDFEFINNDQNAKRPTFWAHNSQTLSPDGPMSVIRPSARGNIESRGPFSSDTRGEDYVRDFNKGWSTAMSRERKEGIVYLMDYDYVEMLYNCGNTTTEWMYDGILCLKNQPWKGRVYILPIIGLSGVDYANEYFICELRPRRDEKRLKLEFLITSSFEAAARVSLNAEVEYNLLGTQEEIQRAKFKPVAVDGLSIQPVRAQVEVPLDAPDPVVFSVSAFVELPDGTMKPFKFQSYYAGEYNSGQGVNVRRDGRPVRLLDRAVRRPKVPNCPPGLTIDRSAFGTFGVLGLGSHRMGVPQAMSLIGNGTLDVGLCSGRDSYGCGLTDFPYDYERLFQYRVLILGNCQPKEFRAIGASVLMPWLKAGGGLVLTGGEHAFTFEFEDHEFNAYLPIVPSHSTLRKEPLQLQPPEMKDHPIFAGIDLSKLPWLLYCHDIQLKPDSKARVIMRVGKYPFIVEQRNGDQITMVVACNHFGTEEELGGRQHLRHWPEWPKLLANVVRYAGGDLK